VSLSLRAIPSGWTSPPVRLATGAAARWQGLRGRAETGALLLHTRSVHGFGLRHPLTIVTVDAAGIVTGRSRLAPHRVLVFPALCWVLELPDGHPVPAVGERLAGARSLS
jgi:hypothetical protein